MFSTVLETVFFSTSVSQAPLLIVAYQCDTLCTCSRVFQIPAHTVISPEVLSARSPVLISPVPAFFVTLNIIDWRAVKRVSLCSQEGLVSPLYTWSGYNERGKAVGTHRQTWEEIGTPG